VVEQFHDHAPIGVGLDHIRPHRARQNGGDVGPVAPGVVADVDVGSPNGRLVSIVSGDDGEKGASGIERYTDIDGRVLIELVSDVALSDLNDDKVKRVLVDKELLLKLASFIVTTEAEVNAANGVDVKF